MAVSFGKLQCEDLFLCINITEMSNKSYQNFCYIYKELHVLERLCLNPYKIWHKCPPIMAAGCNRVKT